MKRIYVGAIVLAVILVLAYSALAHGQTLVQGPVPWVSRIQGNQDSMLVRQPDTDWYEGTINTPFGEGDMVWQDKGGRSEIYLDRGSFVRLDSNSGLVFDRLHDREVRMVVTKGHAEVGNGQNRLMLVDLPGHTLIVPRGAKANVKIADDGASSVTARRGSVKVENASGESTLRQGQRASLSPDGRVVRIGEAGGRSAFEVWSDNRDQALAPVKGPTPVVTYLPEPVVYDLAAGGVWINDPYYGYVWQPRVAPDWTPYRAGKWTYRPGWGWTWVSYEPWGWYPYHYGRWVLVRSGWVWVPVEVRARWSPALVFWLEGPDYIAWHPLPYGVSLTVVSTWSPVVVNRYICSRCITVVHYNDFRRSNYHRYVRPWPGTCSGSSCRVAASPNRVASRPVATAHYRTPRPEGYVPPARSPREQAVYAHRRPQGTTQRAADRTDRVNYGSASRPAPRVNATAGRHPADRNVGDTSGQPARAPEVRGQPTGRANTAARPAPGNRAQPPGADRAQGSPSRDRAQEPAATRPQPGTRGQGSDNVRTAPTSGRPNPSARGHEAPGRPSSAAPAGARPEARGQAPSRPAPSARPSPPANRGAQEARPAPAPRSNPGQAPSARPAPAPRPQPAAPRNINRGSSNSERGSSNVSRPASNNQNQQSAPSRSSSSSSSRPSSGRSR